MTRLETYKEELSNDTDHIEISKELAEQWLDAKIDVIEQIDRIKRNQSYPLAWGDLSDGQYENEVELCGFYYSFGEIQIYQGIQKLAEVLELPLYVNKHRMEFIYKGKTIFQVKDKSPFDE